MRRQGSLEARGARLYPIAFIHYVGDAAPGAALGMTERRRLKRDLSLFPAGNTEAIRDLSRDGWICGLLTEEDMHSGRDASHWIDFRVPRPERPGPVSN